MSLGRAWADNTTHELEQGLEVVHVVYIQRYPFGVFLCVCGGIVVNLFRNVFKATPCAQVCFSEYPRDWGVRPGVEI